MELDECVAQWQLEIGEAYAPGAAGHAVRATLPDGTPAVLKISTPHREAEQEADALERWDGDGAVRLLARDDDRHAMLLERCEPGHFLSTAPDALEVLIELLPRLRSEERRVGKECRALWATVAEKEKDEDT